MSTAVSTTLGVGDPRTLKVQIVIELTVSVVTTTAKRVDAPVEKLPPVVPEPETREPPAPEEPSDLDEAQVARRDAYYGPAPFAQDGAALFAQLSNLVTRTHSPQRPLDPAAFLYPEVELQPDGRLRCIYTGRRLDLADTARQATAAMTQARAEQRALMSRADNSLSENRAASSAVDARLSIPCEHAVPTPWFRHAMPMIGDLHHLFTCEPENRLFRQAAAYGELVPGDGVSAGESGLLRAANAADPRDTGVFCPAAGKGAVARATFYFLVGYPRRIGASHYGEAGLATLLDWHRQGPVTAHERRRNDAIQRVQGNRNPFVDFPELAIFAVLKLGLDETR